MSETAVENALPAPIVIGIGEDKLDSLLDTEWLLTNRIGAYASSTVIGCNTRRYHGLLVAAGAPPGGRITALSTVMEQLTVGDETHELATNEFDGAFCPRGVKYLAEFRNDVAATFVFRIGEAELLKEVILAEKANTVAIRYTLRGSNGGLHLWPFAAMRDYHHLRKVHRPHQMTVELAESGAVVTDRQHPRHALYLISREADFQVKPQWWYRFYYRTDMSRGQEGFEDLYTPGYFVLELSDGRCCQFTASLDEPVPLGFATTADRRRGRLETLADSVGPGADQTIRRLAVATDAFVAERTCPDGRNSATILAGFHWFGDWGRDAFIALPGLLLATGRFDRAREVFRTFAAHMSEGMIPNRFDDRSSAPHYNSIDASLWFIIAAERYLVATGDVDFWRQTLMAAANAILTAYGDGTRFDIHADADALLTGGSPQTQLTWMDAALGREVITPRHGKAVEINALWHSAHRIMGHRCRGIDEELAERYAERAVLIAKAFIRTFWNGRANCLYDRVADETPDESIRPNQLLAVSLPYSPLTPAQQADVVRVVAEKLLTPLGLRTLAPDEKGYRGRYGGSWESRDRAYHQGTAWAWLMGPFIEAYLKVEAGSPSALSQARKYLAAFDAHLDEAGLGFISELFDGDPPHAPGGCIAQGWSVAEVLRARMLIEAYESRGGDSE